MNDIPPRTMRSDYMNFAKLGTAARFGLASSGIADCAMSDLGEVGDLALHGSNPYGYVPLVEAVADRFAIPTECVVMPGGGASFANHLALAALLSPGDEVLIENPTYELIVRTLEYLQAGVTRFDLLARNDWALDAATVAARVTPKTRLVVLTNLHNPTGALASPQTIAAVAKSAADVGAMVLIDEVYLELLFRDGRAFTAFRPDGNIIVTSSLTKAYGLSGLRCGWILAPAEIAERMRRLNDLFASLPAHIAEQLGVVAFTRLPALRARATEILDENRAAYRDILGGHPALEQTVFDHGTTVFPRVAGGEGSGDRLFRTLMDRFETSLVPGRFFGRSEHVRIGLCQRPAVTREGLLRVRAALDELTP